jgi:hypothetical protein
MILVEVIVVGLASYRLFRLLAVDDLTEPIRGRMSERVLKPWQCPWCLGWWCTVAVGLVAHYAGLTTGTPWLVVPAASVIVGFIAGHD